MAGVRLPIITHPLQAAVTEPVKMFLEAVVVSGSLHVYVSQTDRGELVFGASTDPYASYSMRGSLEFTEELASHVLELMPSISKLRVLRQWAGLCDITPDFSPIMGVTPVEGFLVDVGWGTYGFKAGPAAGEAMAELVATGKLPTSDRRLRPCPLRRGPPRERAGRGSGRPLMTIDPGRTMILIPARTAGLATRTNSPTVGETTVAPAGRRRGARRMAPLSLQKRNPAGWTTETWYHALGLPEVLPTPSAIR